MDAEPSSMVGWRYEMHTPMDVVAAREHIALRKLAQLREPEELHYSCKQFEQNALVAAALRGVVEGLANYDPREDGIQRRTL